MKIEIEKGELVAPVRKAGRKRVMPLEKDIPKMKGVGTDKIFLEPMSGRDKRKLGYYRQVAEKRGVKVESLALYNAFGPEIETREFIAKLVECKGMLVEAVKKFFPHYNYSTDEVCYVKGMDALSSTRAKELLKGALDANSISVDDIINQIADIVKDEKTAARDKLRGLELLGKFKEVFVDRKIGSVNTYNLNISEDAATRLLERRGRYDIGTGGKFNDVKVRSGGDVVDGEEVSDRLLDSVAEGV